MLLPIDRLHAHPGNPNVMSKSAFRMLVSHLRESGRCPPVIVRQHPTIEGHHEIIDGHHRVRALAELGVREVECVVWSADDDQAAMLLVTLNRLHGSDDPFRRAALLAALRERHGEDSLRALVPDSAEQVRRLIAMHASPPALSKDHDRVAAQATDDGDRLEPLTFFLAASTRRRVTAHLRAFAPDRAAALVAALGLDAQGGSIPAPATAGAPT